MAGVVDGTDWCQYSLASWLRHASSLCPGRVRGHSLPLGCSLRRREVVVRHAGALGQQRAGVHTLRRAAGVGTTMTSPRSVTDKRTNDVQIYGRLTAIQGISRMRGAAHARAGGPSNKNARIKGTHRRALRLTGV